MASLLAAATPNQLSRIHLPVPYSKNGTLRALPGLTSSLNEAQIAERRKENTLWIQDKWRNPSSNAAKQAKQVQHRRLVKAVKHETLGMNIYAYTHIRSKQVIYSLTRVLDNQNVLDQLIYHGKKSVPAAYRKDVWLPYFSIHFPQTPAGALVGHQMYQQLRELSLQRQLEPPKELTVASEADLARIRAKMPPSDLDTLLKKINASRTTKTRVLMPEVGKRLPQKLRGRKIMNSKAWSVADVAFLMSLYNQGPSPLERMGQVEAQRSHRLSKASNRQKRKIFTRAMQIHEEQKVLAERINEARRTTHRFDLQTGDNDGNEREESAQELTEQARATEDLFSQQKAQAHALSQVRMQDRDMNGAYLLHDLYSLAKPNEDVQRELAYLQGKKDIRELLGSVGDQIRELAQQKVGPRPEPMKETKHQHLIQEAIVKEQEAHYEALSEQYESLPSHKKEVKILWKDERDAFSAQEWPKNVYHGVLTARLFRAGTGVHIMGDEAAPEKAEKVDYAEEARVFKENVAAQQIEAGETEDTTLEEEAERSNPDTVLEHAQSEGRWSEKRDEWMKSQGYVVDQPKSIWSRAKGLFGR